MADETELPEPSRESLRFFHNWMVNGNGEAKEWPVENIRDVARMLDAHASRAVGELEWQDIESARRRMGLTEQELEEIRKRCEAATPGPWVWESDSPNCVGTRGNSTSLICEDGADSFVGLTERDNEFIAHARADIPALADSLRAERARMQEKVCSICSDATDMACADCRIDLNTTVYVCFKSECRDRHEQNCPKRLKESADQEMERVRACEHIAEGDEGWETLRNLCPSTAAVAALRDRATPRPIISKIERIEQRNNHDCLRCCIAIVTGIRYEDVPDFCESHKEAWPSACDEWLSEMGYGLLMFGSSPPDFVPSWLPIIAQGPTSISSRYHFVVVTDDKIIDPWPSQPGLTEIKERYAIVNSGSLTNGFIDHLAARYSAAHEEIKSLQQQLTEANRIIRLWEDDSPIVGEPIGETDEHQ